MLKPIKLTGEQKKVLFLPPTNPIQIKGVAGSGKTTVALYRAKHLLETESNLFGEANVIIFTYNKSLSAYIDTVKSYIEGGYQKDSDVKVTRSNPGLNIKVTSFHSWAWQFLNQKGYWNRISVTHQENTHLASALSKTKSIHHDANILHKKNEFFKEEIGWIKGKVFQNKQEYLDAARTGRGTTDRVTKQNKEILWHLYCKYQESLVNSNECDFNDFALFLIKETSKNGFSPQYTHIVVDEAQDLNKAQIIAISNLVKDDTRSLSIIADAAQRIYKSGFTWSEVGLNVRGGRTVELSRNYRNTLPIAKAARSLLMNEDDTSEFTSNERAKGDGNKPKRVDFTDWDSQMHFVCNEISNIDYNNNTVVLLTRRRSILPTIIQYLENAGISAEEITNQQTNFRAQTIKVCTLSSIKGLEFDYVFILDLNDDNIPFPPGFSDEND